MSNLPYFFRRPDQSTLNMNCINHVLKKVETHAYSHHIERLMIIGNFTLLCGIDPHQVNQWFRERYADAFERVITPNVLSMSQYADGGKLATKPYVSSANYINKMSNYCKSCFYDPKAKKGEKACPFNYLYRNFINKHQELFSRQPYITTHLKNKDTDMIAEQTKKFLKNHMGQD